MPATPASPPDARRWLVLAVLCLAVFVTVLDGTIVNIALPVAGGRAARDDPTAAVDRRRLPPRVHRPPPRRRRPRRPLRSAPSPAGRAGGVRGDVGACRERGRRELAHRQPSADGRRGGADLPGHAGPADQRLHRPQGASRGDRRLERGERHRRRRRTDRGWLAARVVLVGIGVLRQPPRRRHRGGGCRRGRARVSGRARARASTCAGCCCRSPPSPRSCSRSSRRRQWGWTDPATLAGFASAAALLALFVWWELRVEHPMLPVRIFSNLRFSAASVSVTSAFFALFGFIFVITQYFQLIRGYGPLRGGSADDPRRRGDRNRVGARPQGRRALRDHHRRDRGPRA